MKKMLVLFLGIFTLFASLHAAEGDKLVSIQNMEQFSNLVKKGGKKTYIDVYANRCSYCKVLSPKFQSWAEKNAGKAYFAKVNASDVTEVIKEYSIRSFPTVLIFNEKGKLLDRKIGLEEIKPLIKSNL